MSQVIIDESMEKGTNNTQKCSNCSSFFSQSAENNEVVFNLDEINPNAFSNQDCEECAPFKGKRSVSLSKIVMEIFNLSYVNYFIVDNNSSSSTTQSVFGLCHPCKASLQKIYQNYEIFAARRTSDSVLSKKIEILNNGLNRALPWLLNDAINNKNNNNNNIIAQKGKEVGSKSKSSTKANSSFLSTYQSPFKSSSISNITKNVDTELVAGTMNLFASETIRPLIVSPEGIIYTREQFKKEQQQQKQQQETTDSDQQENFVPEATPKLKRAGKSVGIRPILFPCHQEPYSDFLNYDLDSEDDDDEADRNVEMLSEDNDNSLNASTSTSKPLTGILKPCSSSFPENSEEANTSTTFASLSNSEKSKVQFSPYNMHFKIHNNMEEGEENSTNSTNDNDNGNLNTSSSFSFQPLSPNATLKSGTSSPSAIVTTNITATTIELASQVTPAEGKIEVKKNKKNMKGTNKLKTTPYPKKEKLKTRNSTATPSTNKTKSKSAASSDIPSKNEKKQPIRVSKRKSVAESTPAAITTQKADAKPTKRTKKVVEPKKGNNVSKQDSSTENAVVNDTTSSSNVELTQNNDTVLSQPEIPSPTTTGNSFKCSVCSSSFNTKFLCFRHNFITHTMGNMARPYKCAKCEQVFTVKEPYFRHVHGLAGCNSNSSLTPTSSSGQTPQSSASATNITTTPASTGQSTKATTTKASSTGESKKAQRKRSLTTPAPTPVLREMSTRSGKRAKLGTEDETAQEIHSTPKRFTLRPRIKSNA